MASQTLELRWNKLWHLIGAMMVVFIVYTALAPHPMLTMSGKWSDKIYHFSGYFGVMAWYAQFVKQRVMTIILLLLLGISLEFAQMLVNTRSFEWADMLANVSGVVIAAILIRGVLAKLLCFVEGWFRK